MQKKLSAHNFDCRFYLVMIHVNFLQFFMSTPRVSWLLMSCSGGFRRQMDKFLMSHFFIILQAWLCVKHILPNSERVPCKEWSFFQCLLQMCFNFIWFWMKNYLMSVWKNKTNDTSCHESKEQSIHLYKKSCPKWFS